MHESRQKGCHIKASYDTMWLSTKKFTLRSLSSSEIADWERGGSPAKRTRNRKMQSQMCHAGSPTSSIVLWKSSQHHPVFHSHKESIFLNGWHVSLRRGPDVGKKWVKWVDIGFRFLWDCPCGMSMPTSMLSDLPFGGVILRHQDSAAFPLGSRSDPPFVPGGNFPK